MSGKSNFEFMGYVEMSGSRNSLKISAHKPIKPGDHLVVSIKDVQRVMKKRWFAAKLYRVKNHLTPVTPRKPVVKEADPEKIGFSLNLF